MANNNHTKKVLLFNSRNGLTNRSLVVTMCQGATTNFYRRSPLERRRPPPVGLEPRSMDRELNKSIAARAEAQLGVECDLRVWGPQDGDINSRRQSWHELPVVMCHSFPELLRKIRIRSFFRKAPIVKIAQKHAP